MTFHDDFDDTDENSTDHIKPEIKNLIKRGNVTSVEIEELRCNSWEWEALVPAMTNKALIERTEFALDNCFTTKQRPFTTYNQAVEGLYVPELLKRFRASIQEELTFAECLDNVREALGQKETHYLIIADDVKELVEAVERGNAMTTLSQIRDRGNSTTEPPEHFRRLNHDELVQACENIGVDLTCGACAELFFTGVRLHPHDELCATETTKEGS